MDTATATVAEDQELVELWSKEEMARQEDDARTPQAAIEQEAAAEIERLLQPAGPGTDDLGQAQGTQARVSELLEQGLAAAARGRATPALPTFKEREQAIVSLRRSLAPDQVLVFPSAFDGRDDIFRPRVQGDADVQRHVASLAPSAGIPHEENWTINAFAWGKNGGDAVWSELYWRYRIRIGTFDTSKDATRRLEVNPWAAFAGYYDLFANGATAGVRLRFWTGTWHHQYNGTGYTSQWSGWRRSFDFVERHINVSIFLQTNIHQDVNVPYPGSLIRTPDRFDPPGVSTHPNDVNRYGSVRQFDIVDFYVRPELSATTDRSPSYARIDFSLIDVPVVTMKLIEGYSL
jgi:hypothetical protein